jgi:hypothetical protein
MGATFTPLRKHERDRLMLALEANAFDGKAIRTNAKDTSFNGQCDEVGDEEVINCIKSVPCHY